MQAVNNNNNAQPPAPSPHVASLPQGQIDKAARVEESRKQKKISDITLLMQMVDLIDTAMNTPVTENARIVSLLKEMGSLAGGKGKISRDDKNSECIRNHYGDIKHHESSAPNPGGICFERMYHLSKLDSDAHTLNNEEVQRIMQDVPHLKAKIAYVLKSEKPFIAKHLPEKLSAIAAFDTASPHLGRLDKFESIIDYHYDLKIFARIQQEIATIPSPISFSDRESRYFLARKLTIIGELSKELSPSLSTIKHAIKPMSHNRDTLIHRHSNTIVQCDAEKAMTLSQNLGPLFLAFESLLPSIKQLREKTITADILAEATLELHNLSETFYAQLEGKLPILPATIPPALDVAPTPAAAPVKNAIEGRINGLINQASQLLEGVKGKKTLEQLNADYQRLIVQAPALQSRYPAALSETYRDAILAIKETNRGAQTNRQTEAQQTSQVSKQEQKKLLITKRLKQTDKELRYLVSVESKELQKEKKDYIIQHITEIIGQYVRDIADYDVNYEFRASSSYTMDEFQEHAVEARNKGLSHDIFSFDPHLLSKIIVHELLPAQHDIQSLQVIRENANAALSPSFIMLNNLACACARLGLYDEAHRYFEQALAYTTDPERMKEYKLEQVEITGAENIKNITVFDADSEFLEINSIGLQISSQIAQLYMVEKKYDAAYKLFHEIHTKIQSADLEMVSDTFKEELAVFYSNFATTCICLHRPQEAESYSSYFAAGEDKMLTFHLGMASQALRTDNLAVAEQYLSYCANITEPDLRFSYISQHGALLVGKADFNKKTYVILLERSHELEALLSAHKGFFKSKYGDRHLIYKAEIIQYNLNIISAALAKGIIDFDEVKDRIAPLEKALLAYKEKFSSLYGVSSHLGMHFCLLATIYAHNPHTQHTEKLDSYLNQAQTMLGKENSFYQKSARNVASGYSNYAMNVLKENKKYDQALSYLDHAYRLQQEVGENTHITMLNIGVTLTDQAEKHASKKEFKEAVPLYEKAIEKLTSIPSQALSPNGGRLQQETLAFCNEGIGICENNPQRLQQAVQYYENRCSQIPRISPEYIDLQRHLSHCQKYLMHSSSSPKGTSEIDATKMQEIAKKLVKTTPQSVGKTTVKFAVTGISQGDLTQFFEKLSLKTTYIKPMQGKVWVAMETNDYQALQSKVNTAVHKGF